MATCHMAVSPQQWHRQLWVSLWVSHRRRELSMQCLALRWCWSFWSIFSMASTLASASKQLTRFTIAVKSGEEMAGPKKGQNWIAFTSFGQRKTAGTQILISVFSLLVECCDVAGRLFSAGSATCQLLRWRNDSSKTRQKDEIASLQQEHLSSKVVWMECFYIAYNFCVTIQLNLASHTDFRWGFLTRTGKVEVWLSPRNLATCLVRCHGAEGFALVHVWGRRWYVIGLKNLETPWLSTIDVFLISVSVCILRDYVVVMSWRSQEAQYNWFSLTSILRDYVMVISWRSPVWRASFSDQLTLASHFRWTSYDLMMYFF